MKISSKSFMPYNLRARRHQITQTATAGPSSPQPKSET